MFVVKSVVGDLMQLLSIYTRVTSIYSGYLDFVNKNWLSNVEKKYTNCNTCFFSCATVFVD